MLFENLLSRQWNGKPQTHGNYVHITYLIKDWYRVHMNNSYGSIMKRQTIQEKIGKY